MRAGVAPPYGAKINGRKSAKEEVVSSLSVWTVIGITVAAMVWSFLLGIGYAAFSPWPQMIVNDRGHAVFEVADADVRDAVVESVGEATGLTRFMRIKSGPTDQVVLSDGVTVFMTNSDVSAPANVRMFVVNDATARMRAAKRLQARLVALRHANARLYEPDPKLPKGTMIIVRSPSAFPGNGGIGFRPNGRIMNTLAPDSAKFQ